MNSWLIFFAALLLAILLFGVWFLFVRQLPKELRLGGYVNGGGAGAVISMIALHKRGYIDGSGIVIIVAFIFLIAAFIGQNIGFRKLATRVTDLEARITALEKPSVTTSQSDRI